MKIQVRRGAFETNSSSAHSFLFHCDEKHLYDLWKQGKAMLAGNGLFVAGEEMLQLRREKAPEYIEKLERGERAPTVEDCLSLHKLPFLTYEEYCCLHRPGGPDVDSPEDAEIDGYFAQEYIDEDGDEMVFFGWSYTSAF